MKAKECLNPIEPNRFRARCAAACLLALSLLLTAGAAGAQTPIKVVDNTGQSSDVSTSLGNDFAQAFTTDSHRYGYWLTSVDIEFSSITTQPGYKVSIHADNGGTPYIFALGTLKNPASLVQGVNSFMLSENSSVKLEPDTTYWVMLNVSSPGDAEVQLTASDSETGEPDWSIADLVHFRGYRSTGSWLGSISSHALKIAVHARKSPDMWGPVFSSASVNATTLKVTFDEPLDAGSAPAGSAFRVIASRQGSAPRTIEGTGTVSISDKTATVTLDGRVVNGEKVQVRYMEPGTNPLQDAVGNKTADFSGKEADNETPAPKFSSRFGERNDAHGDLRPVPGHRLAPGGERVPREHDAPGRHGPDHRRHGHGHRLRHERDGDPGRGGRRRRNCNGELRGAGRPIRSRTRPATTRSASPASRRTTTRPTPRCPSPPTRRCTRIR